MNDEMRPAPLVAEKPYGPDPLPAERAAELRLAGAPYGVIAVQLGLPDVATAQAAVLAGLEVHVVEEPRLVRLQELARLDAMLLGMWPAARRGDVAAVDRTLRLMARRAEYLGLDFGDGGVTEPKKGDPVDELKSRRAGRAAARLPGAAGM